MAMGLKAPDGKPARAQKPEEAMREAMAAGFAVMEGLPDDPMLKFLDLPTRPH